MDACVNVCANTLKPLLCDLTQVANEIETRDMELYTYSLKSSKHTPLYYHAPIVLTYSHLSGVKGKRVHLLIGLNVKSKRLLRQTQWVVNEDCGSCLFHFPKGMY